MVTESRLSSIPFTVTFWAIAAPPLTETEDSPAKTSLTVAGLRASSSSSVISALPSRVWAAAPSMRIVPRKTGSVSWAERLPAQSAVVRSASPRVVCIMELSPDLSVSCWLEARLGGDGGLADCNDPLIPE